MTAACVSCSGRAAEGAAPRSVRLSGMRGRLTGVRARRTVSETGTRPRVWLPPAATAFPGVQNIDYLEGFDENGEDYYSILGVDPGSDKKAIRKAYHAAMRDCHPDFSNAEEAHEFATCLNEMYETLMDDDRRADYDSLVGFSGKAVNPFRDTTFEANQVFVDEISCIGCTNCVGVCPRTFQMQWEEHGRARAVRQETDTADDLQEAMETCPVNCIHWVTAPQVTLLETVMRKMDRVDAWLLNTGGGHSLNVFNEASLAWEKRQAQVRAREAAARTRYLWQMWEPAGGSVKAQGASEQQPGNTRRARSQATAESAAKAARRWRDYQRHRHQKKDLQLPAPEN